MSEETVALLYALGYDHTTLRRRIPNAIERLHAEGLKRRIKTQCALPYAETAGMLFWALPAGGQIPAAQGLWLAVLACPHRPGPGRLRIAIPPLEIATIEFPPTFGHYRAHHG